MRKKLLISMCSVALASFALFAMSVFGIFARTTIAEDAHTDYRLYQTESVKALVDGSKTFTWLEETDADDMADRKIKHNGDFVQGTLNLSVWDDSQYDENADTHGATSEWNNITTYWNYNAPEVFLAGIPGGAVTGWEAKIADAVSTADYPLMTFEIGWGGTTQKITDAKAYLYAYGSNGTEEVQVSLGYVTFGTDYFSTAYLDLANSGLQTVTRIAVAVDFKTLWDAGTISDGQGLVYMENFTVHAAETVTDGKTLTATDNALWAYNGNNMSGVLNGYTHARVYRANDGSVATGGTINGNNVSNEEYKYATQRITAGTYIVMTFRKPVKVSDYEGVGLWLWAHPQGAEGNYLAETANEFTYNVLKYDATDVNSGKRYTLGKYSWNELIVPLADFADEKGYVERLIILYETNDANGHGDNAQSQYSINIMMHSAVLYTDLEYEVTFDSDGGSAVNGQTVAHGGKAVTPDVPTKFNYNFAGWTLNGAAYDFNTVLTGDITLKATWELKTLGEKLETMNVNLGGKISAIFKYSLPAAITADSGAYVSMTVNGKTTKTYVKDVTSEGDYYLFEVNVAAAEMTKDITVQLFDGNGKEGTIYVKTIRDYADYIIEHGTEDQKTLVKAMLNYGAYAQLRFGVNTDNLANKDYEADLSGVTVTASAVKNGSATGFTLNSYDLILESETTIRLYFTAESADNYDITLSYNDGEKDRLFTLVPAYDQANDRYYADIPNIAAAFIDREFTVKAVNKADNTEYSIKLSALCYISSVLESETATDAQKNVVKALYLYNQAANEFFGA